MLGTLHVEVHCAADKIPHFDGSSWHLHNSVPRQQRLQRSHAGPLPGSTAALQHLHLLQGGRQPGHLDLPPALCQQVRRMAEEVTGMPVVPGCSTLFAVGTSVRGGEAGKTGRLHLLYPTPYCSEVGGQRTTGRYMYNAGACAVGTSVHEGEAGKMGWPHLRPYCTGIQGHAHHRSMCAVLGDWQVNVQVNIHHAGMLKHGCDTWMTTARPCNSSSCQGWPGLAAAGLACSCC